MGAGNSDLRGAVDDLERSLKDTSDDFAGHRAEYNQFPSSAGLRVRDDLSSHVAAYDGKVATLAEEFRADNGLVNARVDGLTATYDGKLAILAAELRLDNSMVTDRVDALATQAAPAEGQAATSGVTQTLLAEVRALETTVRGVQEAAEVQTAKVDALSTLYAPTTSLSTPPMGVRCADVAAIMSLMPSNAFQVPPMGVQICAPGDVWGLNPSKLALNATPTRACAGGPAAAPGANRAAAIHAALQPERGRLQLSGRSRPQRPQRKGGG